MCRQSPSCLLTLPPPPGRTAPPRPHSPLLIPPAPPAGQQCQGQATVKQHFKCHSLREQITHWSLLAAP
eukprot:1158311-Pelagomonas_calceolata.AAC.15